MKITSFFILVFLAAMNDAFLMCPSGCVCYDGALIVQCETTKLDSFPMYFNPRVRTIILKNGKIDSFCSSIQFYSELYFLDLSFNQIGNFPVSCFVYNQKINKIYFSYNNISSISKKSFQNLDSLTVLNLKGNFLEELKDDTFSLLPNLVELNLAQNKISILEAGTFNNLSSLKILHLNENLLNVVPTPSFSHLNNLNKLYLGSNPFSSLPADAFLELGKLSDLGLNGIVSLENIADGAFHGLSNLKNLELTNNHLKKIPTSQFSELIGLEKLRLGENDFTVIETHAFEGLDRLKLLNITGACQLEKIKKDAFFKNRYLETLIINENKKLDTIEDGAFNGLIELKRLIFKGNGIKIVVLSDCNLENLGRFRKNIKHKN